MVNCFKTSCPNNSKQHKYLRVLLNNRHCSAETAAEHKQVVGHILDGSPVEGTAGIPVGNLAEDTVGSPEEGILAEGSLAKAPRLSAVLEECTHVEAESCRSRLRSHLGGLQVCCIFRPW